VHDASLSPPKKSRRQNQVSTLWLYDKKGACGRLESVPVQLQAIDPVMSVAWSMSLIDPISHSAFPDTQATDRQESLTSSQSFSSSTSASELPAQFSRSISQLEARDYKKHSTILISPRDTLPPNTYQAVGVVPGGQLRVHRRPERFGAREYHFKIVVCFPCGVGAVSCWCICSRIFRFSYSPRWRGESKKACSGRKVTQFR